MRKVVQYELLSLDGVAENPDTFFLGRRSYDEWSGYWPGSDVQKHKESSGGVTWPSGYVVADYGISR